MSNFLHQHGSSPTQAILAEIKQSFQYYNSDSEIVQKLDAAIEALDKLAEKDSSKNSSRN